VTPALSVGGEAFWLGAQRKSGVGVAARLADDACVATAQLASTGLVSLTYVHKVSDKVSLASDFMYNWNSREATASVGYDYILRQCRLRARVDSHGSVVS
jgi:mitochondrial import receptor subunit TOM40